MDGARDLIAELKERRYSLAIATSAKKTELDLLLLKSQLENFRRVNRAVKTFLRCEDDALRLHSYR